MVVKSLLDFATAAASVRGHVADRDVAVGAVAGRADAGAAAVRAVCIGPVAVGSAASVAVRVQGRTDRAFELVVVRVLRSLAHQLRYHLRRGLTHFALLDC